eukprot:3389763-Prymnesium_polylepis.1
MVGRVTCRRARPSGDRVRAARAAGRREVGVLRALVGIVARSARLSHSSVKQREYIVLLQGNKHPIVRIV